MGDRGPARGRVRVAAGAVAVVLGVSACTGSHCSFDSCPDVPAAEAGRVTGTDPGGVVRWSTTVADLVTDTPSVSNGHVVLTGCHGTYVVDVASGAVSTPRGLERVLGVVDGLAVGVPTGGDAIVSAERLDAAPGGWSWSEAPEDAEADRGYRASAVVTTDGLVGVRGRTLVAWSPRSGSWASSEIPLPVGSWRNQRVVASDGTHVVVPGADGSVLGVDLATRSVVWRSLATRPDLPAGVTVRPEGRRVVVEVWYPQTTAPAITGEAIWVTERWSLDAWTGAVVSPRSTRTGPRRDGHVAPSTRLRDPASGWTVTQLLRQPPRGSCG